MANESSAHNIHIELVELLFKQIKFALWAETFAAIGFVLAMWGAIHHDLLLTWLAFNLFFCGLVRHVLVSCYKKSTAKKELTYESATFWLNLFIIGTCLSGISWGITGSFLMLKNDIVRQTFEVILLMGVTAAANPLYSPSRRAYLFFVMTAFVPFVIWIFLQGGIFIILGFLALIYIGIMMGTSLYSYNLLASSLQLRFKNVALVGNLSTAKTILENRSKQLEKSLSLINATLESTTDGILVVDANQKIENYNQKFVEMWKIPSKMLTAKSIDKELMSYVCDQLSDPKEFVTNIEHANTETESYDEISFKDGRVFERYSRSRLMGETSAGRVWCFRDITERKLLESKLYQQANFDPLTGLPNRILVFDRLSQAMLFAGRSSLKVALLFLDLDRFKMVNDTLGHTYGDKFLELFSERLRKCVRKNDTVSRVGGDEFLIILSMIDNVEEIYNVARKCVEALKEPFLIEGVKFNITLSIGISMFPKDGKDEETLIHNADIAMYHAKQLGRNNIQFFTEEMNDRVNRRVGIENHLREALLQDELYLLYQPIVNLKTGRITGLEALLRWDHPELGSISPTDFISVAEESALIIPIGEWALKMACAQLAKWHTQGFSNLLISVNLSGRQFKQENLFEKINAVLLETNLTPSFLTLELTESVLMDDIDSNIKTINQLKKMGVMIAIDDFGIGYSSLNYLKQLPVDKLKIDISFIKDINLHVDGAAITAAIIALAAKLKLQVIAEGVEDEDQLNFLISHYCDEVQGFYFSKPLDVEACTKILTENPIIRQSSNARV